jgi:SAM-dependent methyltransferase
MLDLLLPYLRCPGCRTTALGRRGALGLQCPSCAASYPQQDGILDMMVGRSGEVITPFQRIMQTPAIVYIYEQWWRRAGYFIASARSFDSEMGSVLGYEKGRGAGRILDLACGPGVFTRPLAQQAGGLVVGFDLSWPMLRRAEHLLQRDHVRNVILMRGTVFQLPFVDGAFPYINCCGALHLFADSERALEEIVRVLAPGGHLCVQTTLRPSRSWGLSFLLERFIRFGFFDETELRRWLERRNLKILQSERHRISFTFLARRA